MTSLPREVQRVLNARADDAIQAIYDAVDCSDRTGLELAARDLVDVLEDEAAAKAEWQR